MSAILAIAVALLAFVLLAGLLLEDRTCSQLRARHPDIWAALGSPDRFFDDFGSARRQALQKLSRQPDLLYRCSDDLARRIKFTRAYARISVSFALLALVACLAWLLLLP